MPLITDSQIFTAAIETLDAGLAARGIKDVKVQQWFLPRAVGAPAGMALLLTTVTDHAYGWLGRKDFSKNNAQGEFVEKVHKEIQATEITLQCNGSVKLGAAMQGKSLARYPYTAGDLAKIARTILKSDAGRLQLRSLGFGIERVIDVRQPHFTDESGQFEQSANFDFTLAFSQVEETTQPVITATGVEVIGI